MEKAFSTNSTTRIHGHAKLLSMLLASQDLKWRWKDVAAQQQVNKGL